MIDKQKLQEAVEIEKSILGDMNTLQQLPEPDYSIRHPKIMQIKALQILIDLAQSYLNGEIGELSTSEQYSQYRRLLDKTRKYKEALEKIAGTECGWCSKKAIAVNALKEEKDA